MFNSIILKISMAFTSFMILIGIVPAPVAVPEPAPVEVVEIVEVDPPAAPIEEPAEEEVAVPVIVAPVPAPLQIINVPETALDPEVNLPAVIIEIKEKDPEKSDNIFKEQEEEVENTKLFSITPQEGSPLKPRTNITLEQLRDYVIQTNYQVVAFRQKMAEASEDELLDYLKSNGFTIKTNE